MFYTDRYKIARGATPGVMIAGRRWARRLQSSSVRFALTEQNRWHLEAETLRLITACCTTTELDEIDGTTTRI